MTVFIRTYNPQEVNITSRRGRITNAQPSRLCNKKLKRSQAGHSVIQTSIEGHMREALSPGVSLAEQDQQLPQLLVSGYLALDRIAPEPSSAKSKFMMR